MPDIAPFETEFAHSVTNAKYMRPHGETHWYQTADRAVTHPLQALRERTGERLRNEEVALRGLVRNRIFLPGGRYLYASGNDYHQVQNCLLLGIEDTRKGWADLGWKAKMSLLTGAGLGVYWGLIRPNGYAVKRTGGVASGPVPEMIATNESGRAAVQGGDRRCAIWAGLPWWHPDVLRFITAKDWPDYIKAAKAEDPSIPAALDMTNISVCLDDAFFLAFDGDEGKAVESILNDRNIPNWLDNFCAPDGGEWTDWAQKVYWLAVDHMTQTGEPGFSVDVGDKRDEKLRNACTEIVSADDSDICNLGGINLARFEDPREFERAVRLGVLYLIAGTVYSDVPYERVAEIREKNRRLGLDPLGVSEFLIRRGIRYGTDDAFEALEPYMAVYRRALEFACDYEDRMGLSRSVAATSGAPAGTRGITAETTTGWQVVTAVAHERSVITSRAHDPDERETHYVIDPSIARALRDGKIKPTDKVEDSYDLAEDYERIFRMQAYAQSNTDQGISMTVNLPRVMRSDSERAAFGTTLIKYLPQLRGITVYPDGAIAGQPIKRVPLEQAVAEDAGIEGTLDDCASGLCAV